MTAVAKQDWKSITITWSGFVEIPDEAASGEYAFSPNDGTISKSFVPETTKRLMSHIAESVCARSCVQYSVPMHKLAQHV